MSSLLLNEKPLIILPKLAVHIGLNEAIIVQQIHYWLIEKEADPKKYAATFVNDHWWVYNTLEQWQKQFPFWSVMTIRRALESLENQGIVVSGCLSSDKRNRTKWYRIDYAILDGLDAVREIEKNAQENKSKRSKRTPASVQNEQMPSAQIEQKQALKKNPCLTETSSETTQRIHQRRAPAGASDILPSALEEEEPTPHEFYSRARRQLMKEKFGKFTEADIEHEARKLFAAAQKRGTA